MADTNLPMTTLYADAVRHFEAGQLPAAEALLRELNQQGLCRR